MQKEYACQRTKKSITQSNLILSDPQMLKCVNTILGPVFFSEFIHECLLKYYKGYNSKSHLCFCVMIQRSKYHIIFSFDERKVFCVRNSIFMHHILLVRSNKSNEKYVDIFSITGFQNKS